MAITLQKFIANLQQVKKDLPYICKSLLEHASKDFIDANLQAWELGKMPSGEPITNNFTGSTDYSLGWAATRKEKGLPYDHYYLKFTGELSKSIVFDIKINKGQITGDILPQSFVKDKADDLQKMFGDVFGIPKENLTIFVEWFRKTLTNEIKIILFAS